MLRPGQDLRIRIRRAGQEQDVAVRSGTTAKEKMGTIGVHPLVRVGEVLPGSAAQAAGLRLDDGIVSIAGRAIRAFAEIPESLKGTAGQTLPMRVYRGGAIIDVPVTPRDEGGAARI